MKNFKKDKESTKVEKEGIRKGPLERMLSSTHDHPETKETVFTIEIIRKLAHVIKSVIQQIRLPKE